MIFFFFWWDWGLNLGALYLQSRRSTSGTTPPVHFALVILETGSRGLFAQGGLEQ
jgi:hypothetical protein